jgi:hypothetical protein
MVAGVAGRPRTMYAARGAWARWTQTMALLEVAHSVVGEFLWLVFLRGGGGGMWFGMEDGQTLSGGR